MRHFCHRSQAQKVLKTPQDFIRRFGQRDGPIHAIDGARACAEKHAKQHVCGPCTSIFAITSTPAIGRLLAAGLAAKICFYKTVIRVIMQTFDFIEQTDFRVLLEQDFKDMEVALTNESWKSVQVLAGSIVEAMLMDYLVTAKYVPPKKEILKIELAEAIEACLSKNILSENSANLCSVIRSYRNLIHPARLVRLKEDAPNRETATVASTLVSIVARELAKSRIENIGMTADQIMSKLQKDHHSLGILKHLLESTNEKHKRRLLVDLIPINHALAYEADDEGQCQVLAKGFRITWLASCDETREEIALLLVKKIKELDSEHVNWYLKSFFGNHFFRHIKTPNKEVVVDYIFGQVKVFLTEDTLPLIDRFELFLEVSDAPRWVKAYYYSLIHPGATKALKRKAEQQLESAFSSYSTPFLDAAKAALLNHIDGYIKRNGDANTFVNLLDNIDLFYGGQPSP